MFGNLITKSVYLLFPKFDRLNTKKYKKLKVKFELFHRSHII